MKLRRAVIVIAAAAALAAVGATGCGAERPGQEQTPGNAAEAAATPTPPGTTPTSAPDPTESPASTPGPGGSGAGGSARGDRVSEENLIRERLYYDVTGHSFTGVKPGQGQKLGPCTGDRTFADSLPQGAKILGFELVGDGGHKVVHQVAQTSSTDKAKGAADEIANLVARCPGISGGDFGYGDPVTLASTAKREVIYFPAFDSDKAAGGYIVVQAGNRVAVVDVADTISEKKVALLARATADITGD